MDRAGPGADASVDPELNHLAPSPACWHAASYGRRHDTRSSIATTERLPVLSTAQISRSARYRAATLTTRLLCN